MKRELIIERRYPSFHVPTVLISALDPMNRYIVEDRDAIISILNDDDLDVLPHTWGAASFKARIERLKPYVLRHEAWCRWKVDTYPDKSVCYLY